ncbi:MAG TPA: ABC transporter ATP-binding protein, partial [bacterium]|nr:ABC transporter ATP-binding protein [bacterium]
MTLSHGFHSSHKTGSLISRLLRGSSAVESMTDVIIFQILPLLFQLILVSLSISYFNAAVGFTVLTTALVYILFSLYINEKQKRANALYNNISDMEKGNVADVFTNVDSIKYFAKEREAGSRFWEISEKTRELQLDFWNHYRTLESGQLLIVGLGVFFLVFFSIRSFVSGNITVGTFVFIFTSFTSLLSPLSGFVQGIRTTYRAVADFQDLFQYGKFQNDIRDKPGASPLQITLGAIEFRQVAFKYKKRPILSDFSLKIPPHQKVAVVGPSGAGKTTLIRLLFRLYDVESGAILIDGVNIADVAQLSLRDSLSTVPQECILFDDTIYNNIAFSNPQAPRDKVFAAIRFAQLHHF